MGKCLVLGVLAITVVHAQEIDAQEIDAVDETAPNSETSAFRNRSVSADRSDSSSAEDERARAHFVLGRSAYDAGEYDEAIEQFGEAYALSQRSDLLFNLYQAHHRAGNLDPAVDYLERYLAEGTPSDLQRGTLTERLSNLRTQLAQEQAQRERDEQSRQEELERTRSEAQSDSMRNAGIAVLSIGAAAGAMFGVLAGLALKEDGDLDDTCSPVCSGGQVGRLQSLNRGADISLALAGVGVVTGVVLLLVAPDRASAESARLEPVIGPQMGVRGRF